MNTVFILTNTGNLEKCFQYGSEKMICLKTHHSGYGIKNGFSQVKNEKATTVV